jgi:hypothetical protein
VSFVGGGWKQQTALIATGKENMQYWPLETAICKRAKKRWRTESIAGTTSDSAQTDVRE